MHVYVLHVYVLHVYVLHVYVYTYTYTYMSYDTVIHRQIRQGGLNKKYKLGQRFSADNFKKPTTVLPGSGRWIKRLSTAWHWLLT